MLPLMSYITFYKIVIAHKLSDHISYICLQLLHMYLFDIIKKGETIKSKDIYVLKMNQDS